MALNINGTTGISGVDASVSAPALTGTDSNTGISFPSADTIKFSTGGVERLSITNSGLNGDGSGLTGIAAGITMFQRWVFTSPITFGAGYAVISTNLSARSASIGSSMTQSSGVFTFPSTGIYKISFFGNWLDQSANNDYLGQKIQYSTDSGSNYSDGITGWVSAQTNDYASQTVAIIFDVTNVSTHRVRFSAQSQGNGGAFLFGASSTSDLNYFEFIRLGDT